MKRLFLISFFICSSIYSENLLQQTKDYFMFKDYEKTVKTANLALLSPEYSKNPDLICELFYYINESGEEICEQLQKMINSTNINKIKKKCEDLKKDLKLTFSIEEDGFYYIVRYKHEALEKIIKINPNSQYIELIKLKRLLRLSRYALDPVFRFNEDKDLLNLYKTYIDEYPGSQFKPNLIIKTADLYFHLYETGTLYKNQIGISEKELETYYNESKNLYRKVMKEFPDHEISRYIGEIKINNVKLRKEPSTKSSIIRILPAGALVRIIDRSDTRYRISNVYEYWYKVRLADGVEGWIYGLYLNTSFQ